MCPCRLVHEVVLTKRFESAVVVAMHPEDGDVAFLVSEGEIFWVDMRSEEYEKVGEIPEKETGTENEASYLRVFVLMHSLLPTPLPKRQSLNL